MATPLIEVIEDCEQDIERFRSELKDIITEADADGVRDDEEKKEIENFETSIADLEKFVKEKRAEFEKNKAEWDGLSPAVSELLADFQKLTDWGEPNLQVVDQRINEMDRNAGDQYYRDAVVSYETAQSDIDLLIEEYNKQSAAKLTYEEELVAAKQRLADCRKSDFADTEIGSIADQIEAGFTSSDKLVEQLDYVNALAVLKQNIEEISRVEKMLGANEKAKEIILGAYTDLVNLYNVAKETLAPFEDLLDESINEFASAVQSFNEHLEARELEKAELVLQQAETSINHALDQVPARIEQQALLDAERDELAQQLSAAAPKGSLWKLYTWKEGDSFDKLAKTSDIGSADILLGYPNNKKLSDYYKSNNELPAGTLVCVIDPSVEIYELDLEGKKHYLTKSDLDRVMASNIQLMKEAASNYRAVLTGLEKNHQIAYDARHLCPIVTEIMSGWWNVEPVDARSTAQSAVSKLSSIASSGDGKQFSEALIEAVKQCENYQDALIKWLKDMQASLKTSMYWISWADVAAKTTATTLAITLCAPASVPALALYSFGTAAGISSISDISKNATIATFDLDMEYLAPEDILNNATLAGSKAAIAAFFLGGIFSYVRGSAIDTLKLGAVDDFVPAFDKYLLGGLNKLWPKVDGIPEPVKRQLVEVCRTTFLYRASTGFVKNLMQPYIYGYLEKNYDIARTQNPEATAKTLGQALVTPEFTANFYDALVKEHQGEIEEFLKGEVSKLEQ